MIVSDLDGTLLDQKKQIAPRNLEALKRFRQGGGLFTVATGRQYAAVRPLIPHIEEVVNAPAVLCNGGCLYSFTERRALFEALLSESDASELLDLIAQEAPELLFYVLARRQIRFNAFTEETCRYVSFCEPGSVLISSPGTWPRSDWHKLVLRGPPQRLANLRKALNSRFGDRFNVTTSSPRALEIQPATVTKASGIARLRTLQEDVRDRVLVACGDYENDTEMLRSCDVAVCPSNAAPLIKELADLTLCSCDEGLIADVIEKIEAGMIPLNKKELKNEDSRSFI